MQVSTLLCKYIDQYNPDATFIDGVGIGGAVIDRCRQLGYTVVDVQAGGSPTDKKTYANKRTEMWADMRAWLQTGSIPNDKELIEGLIGPEYDFSKVGGARLILENKDDMKKRGIESPDTADSLALTFGSPVRRKDARRSRNTMAKNDYKIFGD
jgi:hypothetical protein